MLDLYDSCLKLASYLFKHIDDLRIEHAAFSADYHVKCFLLGISYLIYTLIYKGVVNVGKRNYLGFKRDRISLKTVRITSAVVSFVVTSGYGAAALDVFSVYYA